MLCEILDYRYITEWNLDKILTDESFNSQIERDWPLITTTFSGVKLEDFEKVWRDFFDGKRRGKPSELRNSTMHSTLSYAGDHLKVQRQIMNVHAACASTIYAFYMASLMSNDLQKPAIVFCADDLNSNYHHWHFNSFGAMHQETGRPFDTLSKGFKMGTGAAVYIVKHPSVKQNLDPKAVILNFGFYTNPELVANPGSYQDIVNNLSHIDYSDVELWNAHATGTPVGDQVEHAYFNAVCGDGVPIVGYKGYVGHCMSAAGAVEIAMMLEDKFNNQLRPNIILGDKIVNDPRIITESTAFTYKTVLKASLGFGGKTAVAKIKLL